MFMKIPSFFIPMSLVLQVRVNSSKLVRVTQVDSEERLKELEQFSVWNSLSSFLKEKLNDTYVNVGLYSTKTCLKVEIIEKDTKYSVIVTRSKSHLCFSVDSVVRGDSFKGYIINRHSLLGQFPFVCDYNLDCIMAFNSLWRLHST